MLIKNTRPTLITLPSGHTMQPGEEREVSEEELAALRKHPATRIWMSPAVGFLEVLDAPSKPRRLPTSDERSEAAGAALASLSPKVDTSPDAPETPAETPAEKPSKWARIDAAKSFSSDELLKAAEGEDDPDVMKALNQRADELTKQLTPPAVPQV